MCRRTVAAMRSYWFNEKARDEIEYAVHGCQVQDVLNRAVRRDMAKNWITHAPEEEKRGKRLLPVCQRYV